MANTKQYRIQALDPALHGREEFTCEESPELTEFLRKRARKEAEAKASACFVMVPIDEPARIAGYYCLSGAAIELSQIPEKLAKKLPHYQELPVTLLGRLARDSAFRGAGIGDLLMLDCLARALKGTADIGSIGVITDPKDARAARFYAEFGFFELSGGRLFLPMKEIKRLL